MGTAVQLGPSDEVVVSLAGIAGAAKEGLLALVVVTGLSVLHELMEHEVTEVVGAKGHHDADRAASCHGHTPGEVTLGGRRLPVSRPRVRRQNGAAEIGLERYAQFASRDLLAGVVLERMLAGVSARRYQRTQEPVGREIAKRSRSQSKSAVLRAFVERTRSSLSELLARRLDGLELAALMIDGIELDEVCHVVALGITRDGTKVPLGL